MKTKPKKSGLRSKRYMQHYNAISTLKALAKATPEGERLKTMSRFLEECGWHPETMWVKEE